MPSVTLERLRQRVRGTHGPQFLLPKRFAAATFESFVPDPAYPNQAAAVEAIHVLVTAEAPPRRRWPLRSRTPAPAGPRGLYLDGPPGIGKTHLLAAAFHASPEPKLFATFDEFAAAAGTLGMHDLSQLLASRRLVCIDEIDLRDPGNIMLLVSLLRAMLAGRPRILAAANADPLGTSSVSVSVDDFRRELGEIAGAFQIIQVDGCDHRATLAARTPVATDRLNREHARVLAIAWEQLLRFLIETHPMYDAAWLDELDLIALDRLEPLSDTDRALRFVRFIDRVYDRDVGLAVDQAPPAAEDLLTPLRNDRRFALHLRRCRSRLIELLASEAPNAARRNAAD